MSYTVFKRMIHTICAKSGNGIAAPVFSNEDGKYTAKYDGVTFTGCMGSSRLTATWGSGHMAQVPKEACYA